MSWSRRNIKRPAECRLRAHTASAVGIAPVEGVEEVLSPESVANGSGIDGVSNINV
jgi:hypothetical protein